MNESVSPLAPLVPDEQDASFVVALPPDGLNSRRLDAPCNFADGASSPSNYTTSTPQQRTVVEPVVIGYDTEWCPHPKDRMRNVVLVYTVHIRCGERATSILIEPSGPDPQHRITLGRLIGKSVEQAIKDKVISEWPEAVNLVVHYGRGDLSALRDFAVRKRQLDAVKGVLATTTTPIEIDGKTGEPIDCLPPVPRTEREVKAWDRSGNEHAVKVTVRDTFLLAEAGSRSLEALGQQLGLEKLQLPEGYSYEDMELLKRERPAEFRAYALRDAEVAALYFQWFHGFCRDRLHLSRTPPTLGAGSVQLALKMVKAIGVDVHEAFGTVTVKNRQFSEASQRYRTRSQRELVFARKKVELAAADAYHGGRTETYMTGPVAASELRDVDLQAAYPTAMCAIGVPDFEKACDTTDLSQFTAATLGFAQVEFETPEDVRFPVFGLRTERGLVFPQRGVTVTTAPEIAAARSLGVEVTVRHGIIVPWNTSIRPFEAFIIEMLLLRKRLKDADGRDTPESKMVKTLTNSLYGKIAQGVRPRNVFDSRSGAMKPLGASALTNPVLAAYITGLTRATIAEMLNSIPREHVVVSVSTDGFLTSADLTDISLEGPASRQTAAIRVRIAEALGHKVSDVRREVLEVKRRATEVVSFRNRGIATTQIVDGSKPILAKASVKVPLGEDPNDYMLALYRKRGYYTRESRKDFIPLREQLERDADLVTVNRAPRVSLDPDMKRRLVNPRMAEAHFSDGTSEALLATDSMPFDTVEEALQTMAAFDGWRNGKKRVLKTMEDWKDWEDFRAAKMARGRAGGRVQVPRQGSAGVLKRQFLRALSRNAWGLSRDGWTHAEVAAWLTQSGYPTTESDVKNAGRKTAQLVEHTVAAAPATLELLRVILSMFPDFDLAKVFPADDLGAAIAALA